MYRRRSQFAVGLVAFVLGLLVVAQLRVREATPGLAGLSAQDLTVLVANLNTHNDELRTEVATLEQELAGLTGDQARGADSLDRLQADLRRLRAWAGLESVEGEGVTITVSGRIAGQGVEDLINELHNAGAEAIAVDDLRLVPGSVVAGPEGGLSIENTVLGDPFEIRAIGSRQALTGSLTRTGGVIAQLAATWPDAVVTVTPVGRLELPPTRRSLVPTNGGPRL